MKISYIIIILFLLSTYTWSQNKEFYSIDTIRISVKNPYQSLHSEIGNWHPSIVYFKDGWGIPKKKYWMAWTPNLVYDTKWENPCIAYSDDGINWDTVGVNNPIVDDPIKFYNADTELFYNEEKDTLYCAWKCSDGHTWTKKSGDGIHWGSHVFNKDSKILLDYFWYNGFNNSKICPVVTVEDNGTKYYVYCRLGRDYLENWGHYRWILDSKFKVLDTTHVDIINNPLNVNSWHFDVFKDPQDGYYYLITDGATDNRSVWDGSYIWLAKSTDSTGKTFTFYRRPVIAKGGWYRATAILDKDTIKLWYGNVNGNIYYTALNFRDLTSWLEQNNSSIIINSPKKAEVWRSNTYHIIDWSYWENRRDIKMINIEYSLDGGQSWKGIVNNFSANISQLFWLLPNIVSKNCRIKIQNSLNPQEYTISDLFYISNQITSEDEITPIKELTLYQNFPNPFNNATVIKFSVPKAEKVSIKIYDILGNEIQTLINKEIIEGSREIKFEANNLHSGIYIYKIIAEESSCMKKMAIIK